MAARSATLIQKNTQLEAKLSLKEIEGQTIIGELEKFKTRSEELEIELRKQRNLSSSLTTKIEYKDYIADEAAKENKQL